MLGGSGLVRTWAPISCGVHSALAYIDIHIYIYMFIFMSLLAAICACPPVFFFFFRLENDCDWISMESNPLDGKKKRESTWNTLFLKRKLKTVAAERGTIIYLWYSTFFFVFLILKDTDFFFSHLGFISLLLFTDETSFCLFPLFRPSLANATLKQRICFFFFAGLFLSFFYSVAAHFFFIVVVACKWQFSCRYAYAQRVVETTTFAIPATFKLRTLVCRGVLLSVPSSSFPKSKGTSRISETKTSKQGERERKKKKMASSSFFPTSAWARL